MRGGLVGGVEGGRGNVPGQERLEIAYVAFRVTNSTAEIYTINPGGEGKTQITHSYNATELSPSYSPAGKKIAYTAPRAGTGATPRSTRSTPVGMIRPTLPTPTT
jgi:Tol biopolymer transport system component